MILALLVYTLIFFLLLPLKGVLKRIFKQKICLLCLSLALSAATLALVDYYTKSDYYFGYLLILLGATLVWFTETLEKHFLRKQRYFGFFKIAFLLVGLFTLFGLANRFLSDVVIGTLVFIILSFSAVWLKPNGPAVKKSKNNRLRKELEDCC